MSDQVDSPDPADEGTTPEDVEMEQDELEAAASSEDADAVDEPESNEDQLEESEAKARSNKLQRLIDSKGGDEDKFADGIYELMNSGKKLHERLSSLEKMLQGQSLEKQDSKVSFDNDEDYAGLKDEITALDDEGKALQEDAKELTSKFNASRARIAKYEGMLEMSADPVERLRLQEKMDEEQDRQSNLHRDWLKLQREDKRIAREKGKLERSLKKHETVLKESRVKQQQRQQADVAEQEADRESFDSSVWSLLRGSKLSQEDQDDLYETVRLKSIAYIQKNGSVSDLGKLGTVIAKKYLGMVDKSNFRDISKQKAEMSKAPVKSQAPKQQGQAPKSRSQGDKKPTLEEVQARIAKWTNS